MTQNELYQSLQRVYGEPFSRPISSIVTGPWGVGKTHTVQKILTELQTASPKRKILFISIFGKQTLLEILDTLWVDAARKRSGISTERLAKVPKYIRPLFDFLRGQVSGVSEAIASFQKATLSDYLDVGDIIVVDDVERKSPNVNIIDL